MAIIAVIVGLVVAAFLLRSRLPRRDWPFGVDVDRPTPLVEIDGGGERHLPSMQWPILEKLALIGLVGGIFSCVLDVDAAAWQVVGATVLLVLANAGHQCGARTPRSRVEFDRRRVRRPRGGEHRAAADATPPW